MPADKSALDASNRTSYRYFSRITTRWIDNDIYGHINNVTYYQFFDTISNEYLIRECGLDIHHAENVGFIVASSCQYLKPISHPALIDAGFRVNRLGKSSVEYGVGIFVEGESAASAFGTFTHVFVNRNTGKSVPIPTAIRQGLEKVLVEGGFE